jgi:ABC-type nitrate/sulfonate/bicarbonate transport system permease component
MQPTADKRKSPMAPFRARMFRNFLDLRLPPVTVIQVAIVIGFVAAWELASRNDVVDPELLPPISVVLSTLWQLVQQKAFWGDLRATLFSVAVAFAIVVPGGLFLGFFIGERPRLHRAVISGVQLLIATPKVILLPIFILALGIGDLQRIVFASTIGIFVTLLYGITAVQSVPRGLVAMAHSLGATRIQLYCHVYLPAMLPIIISGIRIGLIFTVFGVLLSEMYASSDGLGRLIVGWGDAFRMKQLLAGVFVVVLFSVLTNGLLAALEAYCLRRQGR